MDQAGGPFLQSAVTHNTLQPTFAFGGVQRLSRDDLDGLRRVVRILHAVLVGRDHSGGTIENFSKRNPLKKVLGGKPARYPELSTLVSPNDHSGATVDCERIVNELGALLTAAGNADPDRIRRWIKDFHPIASGFRKDHAMPEVFEQARKVVANQP